MNRGGLAGTVFEIDDRFTGYDAPAIARMGFDGGKMLMRIDPRDPATAATLQACAHAVSDLADRRLTAMIEPFIAGREDGRIRNDLSPEAMMRAISVASGLGSTSAYTWLKVPVVPDMEQVMAASTPPSSRAGSVEAARSRTTPSPRSRAGARRCGCRTSSGSSRAGPCSTRPTTTWPAR